MWSSKTTHPRLYRAVYWGMFAVRHVDDPPEEVVRNRNSFPDVAGVRSHLLQRPDYADELAELDSIPRQQRDHLEVYSCIGGFIYLLSPYRLSVGPLDAPKGWTMIDRMYHLDAITYARFIPGRGAKRARDRRNMEQLRDTRPMLFNLMKKAEAHHHARQLQ